MEIKNYICFDIYELSRCFSSGDTRAEHLKNRCERSGCELGFEDIYELSRCFSSGDTRAEHLKKQVRAKRLRVEA